MPKRHPLHSICPYFAMFPEDFVERQVLAYSSAGDIVYDPFSGRGTTVFQSLLMKRQAFGVDINPVAACVSGAKASPPTILEVISRIRALDEECQSWCSSSSLGEFFSYCYHPDTLRQVEFLRENLRWKNCLVDKFIAAMALGALHGESHRSKMYFSNRMPRTISTKPDYSVRWWKERDLQAPRRDVFQILLELAKFRLAVPVPEVLGEVCLADARRASHVHRHLEGRVSLVVTSPPYLDVTDYAEDQWLRLWFLGGASKPQARLHADDRHTQPARYWAFLSEVWQGISDLLKDDAVLVIRIGGRLDRDVITQGLSKSLEVGLGRRVSQVNAINTTALEGRQTNTFRPGTKAGVEHDYVFSV